MNSLSTMADLWTTPVATWEEPPTVISSRSSPVSKKASKRKASNQTNDENAALPKPLRNKSAYNFHFMAMRRSIIGNADEGGKPHHRIGFADLARQVSATWKSMSKEQRSVYEAMAREDKQRYLLEKREYKRALKLAEKNETKKARKEPPTPPSTSTTMPMNIMDDSMTNVRHLASQLDGDSIDWLVHALLR